MIEIKNYLTNWYHRIRGSIGFYPAMIAFFFTFLAIILLSLETPELTRYIKEKAGLFIIDNADTARSLLSTLIGGVISLTVFSFSMVMILLNQASNNYSPRLLPGLISNKPHQVVLGFYIGTILFNITCLINVLPGDNPFQIPAFTILVGILLGPVCLILFVYFIHSISQAIQINNVLERLFRDTSTALDRLKQKMQEHPPGAAETQQVHEWHAVRSREYGRLVGISEDELVGLAAENDMMVKLALPLGMTVMQEHIVLLVSRMPDEEMSKHLLRCLHFENQERVIDNYFFGFKQLTEIVVRAMSPGINDPGTALATLDYMTELFAKRMKMEENMLVRDEDGHPRLYLTILDFKDLVYKSFTAIRTYVAHDPILVQRILSGIRHLLQLDSVREAYRETLGAEKAALWEDARKKIENEHDLLRIKALL